MIGNKYKILNIKTGKAKTLSNGQLSAIQKDEVTGVLKILKKALPDDEVVDQKHHGGDLRVIHHYSLENYNHLKITFPDIAERFVPGTYGENIVTAKLTEKDLCMGDIFALGTAKVQLTIPRVPCATINASYEDNRILKEIVSARKFGWFYRVLKEGELQVGDDLTLLERPYPNLILDEVIKSTYGPKSETDVSLLQEAHNTNLLDGPGFLKKIQKRLNDVHDRVRTW